MIVGLGNDLLDVARVERELREDSGWAERLFTPLEIAYCEGKHRPAEHFAARFAAKEALFKALGTGWRGGLSWREIEIRTGELGRPGMVLSGRVDQAVRELGATRIHLSLTHTSVSAAAIVILES
jgi:holo-[acyl-carrier protein] synthase